MNSGPTALEFREISKYYGRFAAVDSLDLEVHQGELLTILGPSGSGKTTTLMMAAGFVEPDSGSVLLDGIDVTFQAPQERGIGVVFQNYALFPHKTVGENVAFPLRMRGVSKSEQRERVEAALVVVKLSGLEDRLPRELSGGQQQRVALARSMVFNPPVLLMDEPLGALDKKLRTEMQLEVKRLQQDLGLTIVYVTHDQEEALTLSHRIAVMSDGRIEQLATPEEIYSNPATQFVAGFIGESNLIEGELRVDNGSESIVSTESGLEIPVDASATTRPGPVVVSVRPERIQIAKLGALESHEVRLAAEVKEIIYLGDSWIYEVSLEDGRMMSIKRPAIQAVPHFSIGETTDIGWLLSDGLVLVGESG